MDMLSIACELKPKFARMGARLDVVRGGGSVDVRRDRGRERFVLAVDDDAVDRILVRDVRPRERHLLLEMRVLAPDPKLARDSRWRRFLCGHDEREWFAASIPERRPVSNVDAAFEALKPFAVRSAQASLGVAAAKRNRRRNEAFVRQGEWFFLPRPNQAIDPTLVLRDEPLVRGSGKAHLVDECVRLGGTLVYVDSRGRIRSEAERAVWVRQGGVAAAAWRPMRRDPRVFVRGRVRHPDHATIVLEGWHEVFSNTEHRSLARSNLVFLD